MNEPEARSALEQHVRPRAWWRLSIYEGCYPCVTVDEDEAAFWRSEGLTVIELGDVAAERERLLTLAKKRADHEASAAGHHAGKWHVAHEHHLTRHAAMRDLIDALEGPNTEAQRRPSAGAQS